MQINKVHCLFEQSGTFKNEFIKLGVPAEDYDIQNQFGQTDHIVDLYSQIRGGWCDMPSIFDDMTEHDLIMAFFPCTRFENQILFKFRGEQYQQRNQTDTEKLEECLKLHEELSTNYEIITKLAMIALKRNIPLIFENPYSSQHYLTRYWCLKPQVIDKDRTQDGDYYPKPTQYWFINCEPKNNLVFEPLEYVQPLEIEKRYVKGVGRETARSMIHPQYASRFIKKYVIDYESNLEWGFNPYQE